MGVHTPTHQHTMTSLKQFTYVAIVTYNSTCILSRSPCAYDSLAVCITRHMSNSLHVLSSPFLYLYRSHCIAAKWRERLMVCLSPSNWVHTSLNNSGTDEGDRSSFFVSHSNNHETMWSLQTDTHLFRSAGYNWDVDTSVLLRESLLSHDDET